MSLFRKPTRKIQRRQFAADDDEDGDPEAPPPPVISAKKEPVKSKTLLSFADEEEEEEEFKVKKSSQSKRLAKKRAKEQRKAVEDDTKVENGYEEPAPEAESAEPKKAKKKVTLEGLILSGRAALAADGAGDLSDEEPAEEGEPDEGRGFHRYRAETVRAALATGFGDAIPDAALIHAARKTRQQARELGSGGDFIPVRSEGGKKGSRLVREDSGDEEEGRIHVRGLDLPSDKPKRSAEAAASDVELDSEGEAWAEQQLQRVPAIDSVIGELEVNPFSVAPPPPRLEDAPAHLRPLGPAGAAPATAQDLVNALRNRLQDLLVAREETITKRKEVEERIVVSTRTRESRGARRATLDAAYRRAQAARGYCTDLMECLDEKMPELEALERRAMELHRRRCELLQERRRADTRDQAHDVMALAARPGATRAPDPEDKVRRTAEREGRRRARRLAREAAGSTAHRDGDSSDDDLPPPGALAHTNEAEEIRRQSSCLFSDARPAFRSARGVCAATARLRRAAPQLYTDAYIADCLPKLLAPYVRHQLILWSPLADEDNEDFERMDWYKVLMMYGVRRSHASSSSSGSEEEEPPAVSEQAAREDPDLCLVPTVVARVLVPKLTELVDTSWDPMCVRACVRLRGVIMKLSPLAAGGGGGAALRALGVAAAARLRASLAADVFLPPLPPQIMEGAGGAFWRRCLGAGVRLLRAVLALCPPPPLLTAEPVALALIGTLCTAAGASGGSPAAAAAAALASTLPRAPSTFRTQALKRVAQLAMLALKNLDSDNPLHLKALEQARSVIAEAKAAEAM